MTNRIDTALDELSNGLESALGTVLRIYRDGTNPVDPPGIVLGPPQLRWEAADNGVTSFTLILYLIVKADDRMMSRLFDLVEPVANAVWDNVETAAVTDASPGSYPISDTTSLPCYQLTVEMSLN